MGELSVQPRRCPRLQTPQPPVPVGMAGFSGPLLTLHSSGQSRPPLLFLIDDVSISSASQGPQPELCQHLQSHSLFPASHKPGGSVFLTPSPGSYSTGRECGRTHPTQSWTPSLRRTSTCLPLPRTHLSSAPVPDAAARGPPRRPGHALVWPSEGLSLGSLLWGSLLSHHPSPPPLLPLGVPQLLPVVTTRLSGVLSLLAHSI